MINTDILVDNVNIYENYGVFVTEKGYRELVNFPASKKIEINNWQEEDGIEVDEKKTVFDGRELSITFGCHNDFKSTWGFIEFLYDNAYHIFDFVAISRKIKLRLVSQPNIKDFGKINSFSLLFINDLPIKETTGIPDTPVTEIPYISNVPTTGYKLDNYDLSTYGISVLEGTKSDFLKMPNVKKNLTIKTENSDGVNYDNLTYHRYEQKEVKLNCIMRANSNKEFWVQYDAFYNHQLRNNNTNIKTLEVPFIDKLFQCYYKNCSTNDFIITDSKIWFRFVLTFVIIEFRLKTENILLSSEDDDIIELEIENTEECYYFEIKRIKENN